MKRRGFLAGLFALPAAAMTEIKPSPMEIYKSASKEPERRHKDWMTAYTVSIGPSSPYAVVIPTDRMK